MLAWIKSKLQMPVPTGPTEVLRRIDPTATPISRDAVVRDGEGWRVTATGAGLVRLFELPVSGLERCSLTYRLALRTEGVKGVYLQMWCRFAGRGEFFSKGLHDKVRGTTDWSSHEVPFLLRRGESPDLLKLDLVFEGPGTCWVRDVQILRTPLG
jgi:hypothetical protein